MLDACDEFCKWEPKMYITPPFITCSSVVKITLLPQGLVNHSRNQKSDFLSHHRGTATPASLFSSDSGGRKNEKSEGVRKTQRGGGERSSRRSNGNRKKTTGKREDEVEFLMHSHTLPTVATHVAGGGGSSPEGGIDAGGRRGKRGCFRCPHSLAHSSHSLLSIDQASPPRDSHAGSHNPSPEKQEKEQIGKSHKMGEEMGVGGC